MVSFRRQDRERVARGEITVTFRLWKSAKVKAGNRYPVGFGSVDVEDVQVIPAALVSKDDVAPSGCESVQAIWDLAGDHTKTHVTRDTMLYRVQFRYVQDAAPAKSDPPLTSDAIATSLARMDARSSRGAWTMTVLRLIEGAPGVPARVLAAEIGWPTLEFKAHVRRLKALNLTISHEVGYELSESGRHYLASLDQAADERPASPPRRAGASRSPRTPRRSRP